MNLHSKEKILILGLSVCALIITIGYSFAYFTTGIKVINNGGSGASATTQDLLSVTYDAGSKILSLTDAYPNKKASKDFNIILTPVGETKSATYAINLNISSNSFVKCNDTNYNVNTNACLKDAEELVYYLKSGDTVLATGDITEKTGVIELLKQTKTSDTETVYNYTFEIEFKNTNSDQNHNLNKDLAANLEVVFAE